MRAVRADARVAVIIPALDEEHAIGRVLEAIPGWADEVIVVDNGSIDATAARARAGGARVVREPRRGYGAACLAGLAALGACDVVVFLDGDYSDHPEEMARLVDPIVAGRAELVIGSRTLGQAARGALSPQQRIGNRVACALIRVLYRRHYTDLGPFRAVERRALERLGLRDRGFGWTVEMQLAAARARLRIVEVPVSYRPRLGRSKISGTVTGALGAAAKITYVIVATALQSRPRTPPR